MTKSLSKSNLVKSNWVILHENDTLMIDNNSLSDERIHEFQEEEERKKKVSETMSQEEMADAFDEGLPARQVEILHLDENNEGEESSEGTEEDTSKLLLDEKTIDSAESKRIEETSQRFFSTETSPEDQVQAKMILQDAQTQADQIVADAKEQAKQIIEEAEREGFAHGKAEGLKQGEDEARAKIEEEIEKRKKELTANYEKQISSIEPEMVDTLTRIYEHVFHVNFGKDKAIVLHLLQSALSRLDSNQGFIVHVSSDDYDEIMDEKETLRQCITNPNATMDLIEDTMLKAGECMIETEGGIFDCSLGTELSELSRKLRLLSFDRR